MNCFICQEPIEEGSKASLDCICEKTEMGNIHESCACKWESTSGYRCALRCGPVLKPMHVLVKVMSVYFLGSCFFIYCFAQSEMHTFCSMVHLTAVCFLWLV